MITAPKPTGYLRVRLMTKDGGSIISDLIIPPLDPVPEVIIWGHRTFIQIREGELMPKYREAFAYSTPYEDDDED